MLTWGCSCMKICFWYYYYIIIYFAVIQIVIKAIFEKGNGLATCNLP